MRKDYVASSLQLSDRSVHAHTGSALHITDIVILPAWQNNQEIGAFHPLPLLGLGENAAQGNLQLFNHFKL